LLQTSSLGSKIFEFEMATEAEERREAVRQSLKAANTVFSWKRIHWFARSAGFDLTTGAENLGKFQRDGSYHLR
jgi:hypothetical protein